MAQAVYSVNIVGYINKTLPTGLSMVANQLNATPNNSVAQLFGSPAGNITVFKFTGTGYAQAAYDAEGGWDAGGASVVLNPGQGAFVDNASGAPLPLTFVGEVQLNSTVNIHPGLDVYSSVVPRSGTLDTLGFPTPTAILTVFKFNGSGYDQSQYDPEAGWQTPTGLPPSVAIADAFFIDNSATAALPWTVNFSVGP